MFEFVDDERHTVRHLPSGMLFEILLNPVDGVDYDAWEDVYQEFSFLGNYIISLLVDQEKYEPEPEPVGWGKIHSIARKAFKYYRAHVRIERYERPEGPREEGNYLLTPSEDGTGWVFADKASELVLMWKHGDFNGSQEIVFLGDVPVSGEKIRSIPRLLTSATDWLLLNHPDKL